MHERELKGGRDMVRGREREEEEEEGKEKGKD